MVYNHVYSPMYMYVLAGLFNFDTSRFILPVPTVVPYTVHGYKSSDVC